MFKNTSTLRISWIQICFSLLIVSHLLISCEKKEDLKIPQVENFEIGHSNDGKGYIGHDVHLNADVLAGSQLGSVEVHILPKPGQSYAYAWQLKLVWKDYVGMRNAEIHQHVDIPADAAPGLYDFHFIVHDKNGTKLHITQDITLLHGEAHDH